MSRPTTWYGPGYTGRRSIKSRAPSARASYSSRSRGPSVIAARNRGFQRTSGYYGRFRSSGQPTGELKFADFSVNDAAIATGGTVQFGGSLNQIVQGTGESERIGRKFTVKGIHWRYQFRFAENAVGASETVRLILYLDKQCNGATATVTDILALNDYQSFNNLANKDRFRILADRTHTLARGAGTSSAWSEVAKDGILNVKCNIPIECSGTTGAISETRSNNIGVLLLSKNGTGTGANFDSIFRLRFSDAGY